MMYIDIVPFDAVPLVRVRKVHDVRNDREGAEEEERDEDGAVADVRDAARDAEAEESEEDRYREDDSVPDLAEEGEDLERGVDGREEERPPKNEEARPAGADEPRPAVLRVALLRSELLQRHHAARHQPEVAHSVGTASCYF